jgi:hypothetical protein
VNASAMVAWGRQGILAEVLLAAARRRRSSKAEAFLVARASHGSSRSLCFPLAPSVPYLLHLLWLPPSTAGWPHPSKRCRPHSSPPTCPAGHPLLELNGAARDLGVGRARLPSPAGGYPLSPWARPSRASDRGRTWRRRAPWWHSRARSETTDLLELRCREDYFAKRWTAG